MRGILITGNVLIDRNILERPGNVSIDPAPEHGEPEGMDALRALESQWGGTAQQRLDAKYRAYAMAAGEAVEPVPARDEEIFDQVEAEARVAARQPETIANESVQPRVDTSESERSPPPSAVPSPVPSPTASPSAAPATGPAQ